MWQGLVVPLDGSPLAEQALPYAAALARTLGSRVVLLYVRRTVALPDEGAPDLDAIACRMRTSGVDVETHVCQTPRAEHSGRAILDAAVDLGAGLIVMATHGRGGLGRMIYGSVADQVLRHATLPVLLIPPHCERHWTVDRPLRILVPLGGAELDEAIFALLQELVRTTGAELVLLRVAETFAFTLHGDECMRCRLARARGDEPDVEPVRAWRYVEHVEARLRAAGVAAEAQVEFGSASATIARVAREREVDLIAMATHGRGGLARLVLGSVATSTLRQAPVPMLVGRPEAVRSATHGVTEAAPGLPKSPGPLTVRAIMSRQVLTIGQDDTLEEIARLMLAWDCGSALVVDDRGHLQGIVTDSDFCGRECNVPLSDFKLPRLFGRWLQKEGVEDLYQAARTMAARDVMSTPVITAIEDEPISELVRRMIACKLRQLPVVRGMVPVGMVTRHHLLRLVAHGGGPH